MDYAFISDSQVDIERSILLYLSKYNLYCFKMHKNNISGLHIWPPGIIECYHDHISMMESQVNTESTILSYLSN